MFARSATANTSSSDGDDLAGLGTLVRNVDAAVLLRDLGELDDLVGGGEAARARTATRC